ncbi:hypothetical protein ACFQQB_52975 [Nonomuraea rubra]|uniref:AfsR/SARP family transcriptional regulator n=1 Tax=Nonomuraea rubra TaxID=46180 RepID=UPI0036065D9A
MDGGGLSIALLGPLEVRLDGAPVLLTTSRLRALLAVLAVFAGDAVTVERLALALWGGAAGQRAAQRPDVRHPPAPGDRPGGDPHHP